MKMLFLTVVLLIAALILIVTTSIKYDPLRDHSRRLYTALALAAVCLVMSVISWNQARQDIAGLYFLNSRQTENMSAKDYFTLPFRTALQSNIPLDTGGEPDMDKLRGQILVFIKPRCKDCEAIHSDLMDVKAHHPNILFVNTQSPEGKILIEKCTIDNVPSAVYIMTSPSFGFYKYALYENVLTSTNPDGTEHRTTVYVDTVIPDLLQAQIAGW